MFPIFQVIGFDSKSRACGAEEGVLCGIDDNAGVPAPYCKVAWLRICDPSKVLYPVVKLGRINVAVRETRLLVNIVNQV